MQLGERLRAIRESKNLSQGVIEERSGLLRCYVSRCENQHTVPSVDTLEKWARALEVPMYQLFYDGDKPLKLDVPFEKTTKKLSKTAKNHLRKVMVAFGKMDQRNMAIVSGLASKMTA